MSTSKMSAIEATALEAQVVGFHNTFLRGGAEEADRDYYATLALNLRSLSKAIDKRFGLGFDKAVK